MWTASNSHGSGGDVIADRAWQPHTHAAAEDAVLFRVSDEAVISRLGFPRAAD